VSPPDRRNSPALDPARLARGFALVVGLSGVAAVLYGINYRSDLTLLIGVALFLPGLVVALRTKVTPPAEQPELLRDRVLVAADEEVGPRGKCLLLSGTLTLVGALLLLYGFALSASGIVIVGGALLVVGIVAALVSAQSS
jgi:hypothetical protein